MGVLPLSSVIRHKFENKYYRLSVQEQYMGSRYLLTVKNRILRRVLYHLFNVLGHFSVILHPRNFCKVEFTHISSARKTARKSRNYFNLLALN